MHWRTRLAHWLDPSLAVTPVPVGRDHDGLTFRPATPLDKPWPELAAEFEDAREAWRKNPLARRLVGLVTAYTVGNGLILQSDYKPLARFLTDFTQHNRLDLRLPDWSDELARSGELFPVLFTNPVSGMSTLRTVPACRIQAVEVDPNDYEAEIHYQETPALGAPLADTWWAGPASPQVADPLVPLMLHYAVNRPIGSVRGESDLAPILPWLRRYSRWLEDRVRLNATLRAFLWIVHAPSRLRATLEERYRTPPDPGTVIIADADGETWQAVTPTLHAADAEKDGRAIRWMIVAGGPGTALLDLGEGEDSNLATGTAMAEQRRRFLRRRQAYLAFLLADLALTAWQRYAAVTRLRTRPVTLADLTVATPDISPDDNATLATAAQALTAGLSSLANLVGDGPAYRRMALRLFAKFLGEPLPDAEAATILAEGERSTAEPQRTQRPEQRRERNDDGESGEPE